MTRVDRGPALRGTGYVLPETKTLRRIADRDAVTLTSDALTPDNVLHYSRGRTACKRCGEPRRADALNEEGVCRSLTVCMRFMYQEEELMASTLSADWKSDSTIPPRSNEDVARIMREEGFSRRRAYALLKERRAKEIDISTVSEGQRVAVLGVLINDQESRRDVHSLIEELHLVGVKIDGHDVTKTLFALQRQGFVRFRERNRPRTLYAIVVTNAGHEAWLKRLDHNYLTGAEASVTPAEPQAVAGDLPRFPVMEAITKARELQQAVDDLDAGPDTIKRPWIKGNLGDWPSFRDLRDRLKRSLKLNVAAKLLEEVGGHDDLVLALMAETEFTPLEDEVIELFRKFGEIE